MIIEPRKNQFSKECIKATQQQMPSHRRSSVTGASSTVGRAVVKLDKTVGRHDILLFDDWLRRKHVQRGLLVEKAQLIIIVDVTF
jgi:hypothetical protein